MTNCAHFDAFDHDSMTTLIENLYLKFQKCLGEARKDLKPSSAMIGGAVGDTVTITLSSTEAAEVAANAIGGATKTTTAAMTKTEIIGVAVEETTDDDETDLDDAGVADDGELGEVKSDDPALESMVVLSQQQHKKAAVGKRGQTGRKRSGRGATTEEEDNSEDKVVKILPNLIIVPPGGKPPAGTLNTAPVTVPKLLHKILPKPIYGGIGVTSGMLPGGGVGFIGGSSGGTHNILAAKPVAPAPAVQEDLSCHICNKVSLWWFC